MAEDSKLLPSGNEVGARVVQPWTARFTRQTVALLKKNGRVRIVADVLVLIRNPTSIISLILGPFIGLGIVFIIDTALRANARTMRQYQNEFEPTADRISAIPNCLDDLFITNTSCKAFAYAPNTGHAKEIALNMAIYNSVYGGKEIMADEIVGLPNAADLDDYLLANPETVLGAIIFKEQIEPGSNKLMKMDYTLQFNSTSKFFKGQVQDPNIFAILPIQNAAEREIHRHFRKLGGLSFESLTWEFFYQPFAHPALDTVSFAASYAGTFIFVGIMSGALSMLQELVREKETGLRQALRTAGLLDSSYWASWWLYHTTINLLNAIFAIIAGYAIQLDLFTKNDPGLLFVLMFLFCFSVTGFVYMLTPFFKTAASTSSAGPAIFIVGIMMQGIVPFFPYTPVSKNESGGFWFAFFSAYPWNLLAMGLYHLGQASATEQSPGLSWSQRDSYCVDWQNEHPGEPWPTSDPDVYVDYACVLSIGKAFEIMAIQGFLYLLVAVYFDNIVKNENGVRRPFWFFLQPGYWVPSNNGTTIRTGPSPKSPPLEKPKDLDSDVQEEEDRMQGLFQGRTGSSPDSVKAGSASGARTAATGSVTAPGGGRLALEVYGLRKWFQKSGYFQAVKNSWFAVEEGQLFCLLGPNGAGKSTTINCLTGMFPPDAGDALVYGESLTGPGGLDRIRSMIGVCPQFDVLWDRLTGKEHLELYGQLKGLPASQARQESSDLLDRVKLADSATIRTVSYSGGMKRRLSVALSLLGDPKVIYLDEPTTGMDPVSRRHVWDIIEEAKKGRAVILTTHSMEEADILGDRIAIMARGSLRCIGSSLRLKSKFGTGYSISVSLDRESGDADVASGKNLKDFFLQQLGIQPSDETKAYIQYLVPKEKEGSLPQFMARLEALAESLGVTDMHVALTTLEEVFLNIARQAEIEADDNGGGTRDFELEDNTVLTVPLGQESVQHEESGVMYNIKWGQDEAGDLQIIAASAAGN